MLDTSSGEPLMRMHPLVLPVPSFSNQVILTPFSTFLILPLRMNQPTALQLLTPHTTAHFPKSPPTSRSPHGAQGSNRISRAYSHFLFHRDHLVAPNTPNVDSPALVRTSLSTRNERRASQTSVPPRRLSASVRSQQMPTPTASEEQEDRIEGNDGTYLHPVHLTFIISMPDSSASSYSQFSSPPQPIVLTPLVLGTTQPNARLPSILIKQDELDSWWDLPPSSPRLYNVTSGLTAGQMLQLEIQRERMEREVQRARTIHAGGGAAGLIGRL